jgi:hypothetical protein
MAVAGRSGYVCFARVAVAVIYFGVILGEKRELIAIVP